MTKCLAYPYWAGGVFCHFHKQQRKDWEGLKLEPCRSPDIWEDIKTTKWHLQMTRNSQEKAHLPCVADWNLKGSIKTQQLQIMPEEFHLAEERQIGKFSYSGSWRGSEAQTPDCWNKLSWGSVVFTAWRGEHLTCAWTGRSRATVWLSLGMSSSGCPPALAGCYVDISESSQKKRSPASRSYFGWETPNFQRRFSAEPLPARPSHTLARRSVPSPCPPGRWPFDPS